MTQLNKAIISVRELLQQPALRIPSYQRPYKWTQHNLHALLDDIRTHRDKSAYRLGSIVFHRHTEDGNDVLDIVDGQQRTLTLILLLKALLVEQLPRSELKREDVKTALQGLSAPVDAFIARQTFSSNISYQNLHQNFLAARRAVDRPDFTEELIDFLLHRCQLVTFVLSDISEAFQFFDSQNARGRDLEPHDLLKAFHLREFAEVESHLKAQSVSHWESLDSEALAKLFANYLFRIRRWAQGKRAQFFSKAQVSVFKGVNLEQIGLYPYVQPLSIAHHFVDDYNQQYQRRIDHQQMRFPFHLDQMIINGRRFFEMVTHYQQKIDQIVNDEWDEHSNTAFHLLGTGLDSSAQTILHTLNTYSAKNRTGDKYIRTLFDCALIYYIDKFGTHHISQAIEKLFVWAYRCRLRMQVVQLATMDNYALEQNVFEQIKQAVKPSDVLSWPLSTVKSTEVKGTRLDEIKTQFQRLKYYE